MDLKKIAEEIREIIDEKQKDFQLTFEEESHKYTMLDKLNKILISLEDAVDSEDWSLVQHAINKLEELYEKIEMEEQFGEYDD